MKSIQLPPIAWLPILLMVILKLLVHLLIIEEYGFHRDEFLYLALGKHPDWGFWSNPPLIGWLSAIVQNTLGGDIWAIRLIPVLAVSSIVVMIALMAREMGGGTYAQTLAAIAAVASPSHLRMGHMFQPVSIDVAFWTIFCLLILKYFNTSNKKYLLYFGVAFGFGMLNKYMVGFFLIALLLVLPFSPHRKLLWSKHTLYAALIAFVIILPNLIWQYSYNFPVVTHMNELTTNQLSNVSYFNFLKDQLFKHPPAMIIWIPGLIYLFRAPEAKAYRLLGWLFIAVILIFLVSKGKSYYTLGIFPVLLSAGAVWWEKIAKALWVKITIPILIVALLIPLLPVALPIVPLQKAPAYYKWYADNLGMDGILRWEDGELHELPQDYADMTGWREIADLVTLAYQKAASPDSILIYGDHYGIAGAINHFAPELPEAHCFSDTYMIWTSDNLAVNSLIYVNKELGEDVAAFFEKITLIGRIDNPISRQFGESIYLCEQPKGDFSEAWKERVHGVRAYYNISFLNER